MSAKSVALPRVRHKRRRPLAPAERRRIFWAVFTLVMFVWVMALIFGGSDSLLLFILVPMYVLGIPEDWATLRWFARWCAGDVEESDPGPIFKPPWSLSVELARVTAVLVLALAAVVVWLQMLVSAAM